MKPTQQEIIELAREAGVDRYTKSDYCAGPYWAATDAEIERLVHLALERFGAGGEEPICHLMECKDIHGKPCFIQIDEPEGVEGVFPVYTHPSPTSGGNPTGYLVGHSGEYHYFRRKADAEREKAEQERCSGESCGDVEPVFRHPSPTDLRAEYLRGLEDAKKACVASELIDLPTIKEIAAIRKCAQAIEALKGKQ